MKRQCEGREHSLEKEIVMLPRTYVDKDSSNYLSKIRALPGGDTKVFLTYINKNKSFKKEYSYVVKKETQMKTLLDAMIGH